MAVTSLESASSPVSVVARDTGTDLDRDVVSRDGRAGVGHHPQVDMTVSPASTGSRLVGVQRRALVLSAPVLVVFLAGSHAAAVLLAGAVPFVGYVDRFLLFGLIGALGFATLGSLVARAQQKNVVASIAAAIGWGFGISIGLDVLGTALAANGSPAATWLVWVAQWIWPPAMFAVPSVLTLRLPGGTLPHQRWRVLEVVSLGGLVVVALQWATAPYGTIDVAPLAEVTNPVAAPALSRIAGGGLVVLGVAIVGSLAVLLRRTARAAGVERSQLRWVLLGLSGAVTVVGAAVLIGPDAALLSSVGIALVPATMAVAILRHRLFDVEVAIDRSLTYGLVSVAILLLYAVSIELLSGLLGRTTGAPLAATGLVALAVLPLRDRAQRFVTRLRYGDRGDPHGALDRLGTQLAAASDRTALIDDVTTALVHALRLAGAAITVDERVVATAGSTGQTTIDIPLTVRGEQVGSLRVTERQNDPLSKSDRRLLDTLARHIAQTVRAERLHDELQASRARLLTAHEEERRRIRRDLHDELGPTLSAAGLAVEQVAIELAPLPEAQAARLEETAQRLRSTVATVRSLVAGLRPATLDELGLPGALRELVRRLEPGALSLDLQVAADLPELSAATDAAIYRIVGEALTNVIRHAAAANCRITVAGESSVVEVIIEDDGRGLPDHIQAGLGLTSMRHRAEELGGTFSATTRPVGGTLVIAQLPASP